MDEYTKAQEEYDVAAAAAAESDLIASGKLTYLTDTGPHKEVLVKIKSLFEQIDDDMSGVRAPAIDLHKPILLAG